MLAEQDSKVIVQAVLSMHVDEAGLDRNEPPPPAGSPADAAPWDQPMIPWQVRVAGGVDLADRAAAPAELQWWMRTPPVGDTRHVHQALLAHATDLTLIGTALRPIDGVSQADSTVTLHTAVTSHTLWFHRPFRTDDWLLVTQQGPVVAHGRSFDLAAARVTQTSTPPRHPPRGGIPAMSEQGFWNFATAAPTRTALMSRH